MAMTITELQNFIDEKPDVRSIVNEIADYLQANPGGGGGWGTSGTIATLTGDGEVDLAGNGLTIGFNIFHSASQGLSRVGGKEPNTLNIGMVYFAPLPSSVTTNIEASFDDDSKLSQITLFANATDAKMTFYGDMIVNDLIGGGTTGLSIDDTGKIIRTP